MKGLIFVYLLTYGGSLVALFNPFVGLLIYIAFSVLRPDSLWRGTVPPGNYSRTVAIALLVGWAFKGFGDWHFGRAKPVVGLIVAFGAWLVVTTSFAVDSNLAWRAVEDVSKIIIPFFVGVTLIDSVRQLKQVAWVIALSEGYVAFDFNLNYFGGYNRLWLEGFASLDNNGNAVALVTCVAIALFLGLYSADWRLKAVAFGAALLMVHAILFSFSRGGMVSLIITCVLSFLIIPKRAAHYGFFVLGFLIVLRLAGPQVVDRFQQSFITEKGVEGSADERFNQWSAAQASIRKNPLGVGPDQWKVVGHEYVAPLGQACHSTWIQVGAEEGVPGLVMLMSFYLVCMARVWPMTREGRAVPDPWFRHLARMSIASLAGFMVAAQFVTLYLLETPYYIVLVGTGLLKMDLDPVGGVRFAGTPRSGPGARVDEERVG